MLAPGSVVKGARSVYLVRERLAEGGMAAVWLAEDTLTGERVVVKEPKPLPASVKRSRFEAEILRGIRHPHIIRYIDEAEAGEALLLVLEHLPGGSLADLVASRGPLDPEEAGRLAAQLLLALDALHSMNIIHRDVKPRNVLLDERGEARLIDLGTAVYYNVSGVGETVVSAGGYTAPEQYLGYAFPQSDIWGAMATLFFLLTGRDPAVLLGSSYHRHPPPRPVDPRLLVPTVPPELAEAVKRGMAWHVLDRFSTAREALDFIDGHRETLTRPVVEVFGFVVPLEAPRLLFGRMPDGEAGETGGREMLGVEVRPRLRSRIEDGTLHLEVRDPRRWVSRPHFEILAARGGWCIRDLGSTNRTAVMTKRGVFEIWRGRGRPGPCFQLERRSLILVAYGSSLRSPPYLTVFFRAP